MPTIIFGIVLILLITRYHHQKVIKEQDGSKKITYFQLYPWWIEVLYMLLGAGIMIYAATS